MFIETGCHAYNLNRIAYAEWDEEEMWIDLYFPGAGKSSITGDNALLVIDAIKGRARIDEYHQHSNLKAIKFSEEVEHQSEGN